MLSDKQIKIVKNAIVDNIIINDEFIANNNINVNDLIAYLINVIKENKIEIDNLRSSILMNNYRI